MGLDSVELVMAIEEEFCLEISDGDAVKLRTPGDLINLITRKIGCQNHATCVTQKAFHGIRRSLMRRLNLKRSDIRPETRLKKILPKKETAATLRGVTADLGMTLDPPLVRPVWLCVLLWCLSILSGIAAIKYLHHTLLTGVAGATIVGCVAIYATRSSKTKPPKFLSTIEQLCLWGSSNHPSLYGAAPAERSREQIALRVRQIVIDQLGINPNIYRENARFLEDFGMD